MKISVSLSEEDVKTIDAYAETNDLGSRSAAVQKAVRLLRDYQLGEEYKDAWTEWEKEEHLWETTTNDGLQK